jgi:hypothetical protein
VLLALVLVALLGTGPLVVQAEVYRPGGLLRMAVLAAGLAAAASLLALGPFHRRPGRRSRYFLAVLEGLLIIPLAAWCVGADTPPVWFGALLAVLGGMGLSEILAEPAGGPPRTPAAVAALFLLLVGVSLFWLAGD